MVVAIWGRAESEGSRRRRGSVRHGILNGSASALASAENGAVSAIAGAVTTAASTDAANALAANPAGVLKLMASHARFLAELTIAGVRWIRQNGWQILRCRWSLRINRPESAIVILHLACVIAASASNRNS